MSLAAVVTWALLKPEAPHRPGEAIEGITQQLARSLPPDYPRVEFTDVTADAGIDFVHFQGERSVQLPEDMGSGAAWGDYDNDGWLDLFVVNHSGPLTDTASDYATSDARCALYHNEGNGRFVERAVEAAVDCRGFGMGAAWGDHDDDGWLDLFVTFYGENRFYHNNGDGTFEDRTTTTGLGGIDGFWTGASWADYDRDGDLDIYVTGYVKYERLDDAGVELQYDVAQPANLNPSSFEPERNLLYRNSGDGTFEEVALRVGVGDLLGRSLSASWADFDGDGWLDLYVANDISDNVLFRNRGDGFFEDISHRARVADYRGAMGLAVGDWDGDLDLDLFVSHWVAQENALYQNTRIERSNAEVQQRPPLQFMDVADRYGLGQIALRFVGWGTSFFDYDNDGLLDLFVTNGSTLQEDEDARLLVPMRDQLFWNAGSGEGFFDVSAVSGDYFAREMVGRGAAFADYDRDGDVDIFVTNNGAPAVLLRNDGGNRSAWIAVELQGTRSTTLGEGSIIRIVVDGRAQVRQIGSQSSYLSQNSAIAHFGLGEATNVDTVEVSWPSGVRDVITEVAARQTLTVVEGTDR